MAIDRPLNVIISVMFETIKNTKISFNQKDIALKLDISDMTLRKILSKYQLTETQSFIYVENEKFRDVIQNSNYLTYDQLLGCIYQHIKKPHDELVSNILSQIKKRPKIPVTKDNIIILAINKPRGKAFWLAFNEISEKSLKKQLNQFKVFSSKSNRYEDLTFELLQQKIQELETAQPCLPKDHYIKELCEIIIDPNASVLEAEPSPSTEIAAVANDKEQYIREPIELVTTPNSSELEPLSLTVIEDVENEITSQTDEVTFSYETDEALDAFIYDDEFYNDFIRKISATKKRKQEVINEEFIDNIQSDEAHGLETQSSNDELSSEAELAEIFGIFNSPVNKKQKAEDAQIINELLQEINIDFNY